MLGLRARLCRDEKGFTLPELLATIVILGILVTIGVIIFLALLERWRVHTATDQLISDMRLAHGRATNQLTDWRVVLVPENEEKDQGADYYLVKLKAPYNKFSPPPEVVSKAPRTLPGNVKVVNTSGNLDKQTKSDWIVAPSQAGITRTLEFDAPGTMNFYQAVTGGTCVTVDASPANKITVISATSQTTVESLDPEECPEVETGEEGD
ncbi:MAG: Tfp pilus assembly protein FimT/FimU [Rubrobacteraceae bacterium]